jgi:succinate dehydrogenase / fumarate reductase cytochrome b subunit
MSRILLSSITKKFVMALAGLFLLTFLPVHLTINLFLLKTDPAPFNNAARFMATFPVIRIFEIVLFGSILIHITWALILQIQNWLARPAGYVRATRSETSFFSKFMIWTGSVILIFFVLHFFNFFFVRLGWVKGNPEDFYTLAHNLFKIRIYDFIYLTCFTVLGFHLYHAFSSAFQTLGLNHRIWTPVIKVVALIYSVVIPSSFAFIAISLWLFR